MMSEGQKARRSRRCFRESVNGTSIAFSGESGCKYFVFNPASRLREPMRRTNDGR